MQAFFSRRKAMNIEILRQYCLTKPFTTEEFPFDDVNLVFKVMNKMFLLLPLDNPVSISVKCNPDYAIELREKYRGIEGAYHFNKKYWNSVSLNHDNISDKLILDLIDHSYDQVILKLPKFQRGQISEALKNK